MIGQYWEGTTRSVSIDVEWSKFGLGGGGEGEGDEEEGGKRRGGGRKYGKKEKIRKGGRGKKDERVGKWKGEGGTYNGPEMLGLGSVGQPRHSKTFPPC